MTRPFALPLAVAAVSPLASTAQDEVSDAEFARRRAAGDFVLELSLLEGTWYDGGQRLTPALLAPARAGLNRIPGH